MDDERCPLCGYIIEGPIDVMTYDKPDAKGCVGVFKSRCSGPEQHALSMKVYESLEAATNAT
jgi:hypothetical protein